MDLVANEYEAKVFVCPDPAFNSDSGIQIDDLNGYIDLCEWRTGDYGPATHKAVDDWATIITAE